MADVRCRRNAATADAYVTFGGAGELPGLRSLGELVSAAKGDTARACVRDVAVDGDGLGAYQVRDLLTTDHLF